MCFFCESECEICRQPMQFTDGAEAKPPPYICQWLGCKAPAVGYLWCAGHLGKPVTPERVK